MRPGHGRLMKATRREKGNVKECMSRNSSTLMMKMERGRKHKPSDFHGVITL